MSKGYIRGPAPGSSSFFVRKKKIGSVETYTTSENQEGCQSFKRIDSQFEFHLYLLIIQE
jgi:hypothetical protein